MSSLLLLPGFDGTGELFAPLLPALDQHDVTIARYHDEKSFDDYVDTASALLHEDDNVLIAESFSGPIALALMARFPNRIRCAALCVTFVVAPHRALTRLARLMPASLFDAHPGQRMILRHFCLDQKCSPALEDKALSAICSVKGSTIKQRFNVLADIDMRRVASTIATPILILRATRDRVMNRVRYQQLIDALPHATVQDVDGPHLLLQTRAQLCADAILQFIGTTHATLRPAVTGGDERIHASFPAGG
jgi:pimeloyl-[acyl-carrier protein] methyl ester esterase